MIYHQLAIPTTIELIRPFKCSKPLNIGEWGIGNGKRQGRGLFNNSSLSSLSPVPQHIVTILYMLVLTGGFLHDC